MECKGFVTIFNFKKMYSTESAIAIAVHTISLPSTLRKCSDLSAYVVSTDLREIEYHHNELKPN